MSLYSTDTIFALASAPGRGGVQVIRLSGPKAGAALSALTGRPLPAPRRATLARLKDQEGEVFDQALVLWFPAPDSFTGEDVAELHLHGGRAVLTAASEALAAQGLRVAEPGEFSRRAFEAGKLDLTEAEAIADLVDAETAAQRRQALRQMDGVLGQLYEGWRHRLVRALAHLEADIDFPDEDLPHGLAPAVVPVLTSLYQEIGAHLADGHRGERLRDGFSIAILGAPNAGKSSLLNALARRDAAIVSATAGTTRDVIEVNLDLGGFPVILADTAGLRDAADEVEREGIRRALARAEKADLKLLVLDCSTWNIGDMAAATLALADGDALVVLNKRDLCTYVPAMVAGRTAIAVSAATGEGLADLLGALERIVGDRLMPGAAPSLTRARHRQALEDCRAALARALRADLPELAAEDARLAARALGRITGRVDVEDLLDVIFRDFCIGK
ncbi:tRNA uridine-5-carboxymethylaminomethyl(34) synthesis GTPase MnmE [Nitrospirillum sp. BR 11164]|uniref:tRNA uridine-5-carboxymethylaminomethyl(34) synthesis GTPase MnmE n=1 Tax=Nitrospirillum sp. BR 11164 TaxID=3104324 RepID=UPI002AFFE01D|nr:tRNA uridine-5-carboxymethylaminomethyl(34) synthesis GTPase MnmE [Nitrospirillum sp. BR 11164]MEA1649629.1 tRNA uridine-5-carboxymethylaminomethyl(34) synthesis GTPase MnmE [Nitrospirillum sp. BR 11164]